MLRWFDYHTAGWFPSPALCVGSVKALWGRSGQPNLPVLPESFTNIGEGKQTLLRREYVMVVFVLNQHGEAMMPCKERKARLLLKEQKVKIIQYQPFTIQLLYGSSGYKQETHVGIDIGSKHIGVAITSGNRVLTKGVIKLRDDVKGNLEIRKTYRRNRRSRKTRYRKPRFLNRVANKKTGWLPPSIKSRIDNTFRWMDRFTIILPKVNLHLEVGKFDVQRMMNPTIKGIEYQQGKLLTYHEVRYFVLARDRYTCQVCKQKNKIFNTHHIVYRSHGGSDRADNLITVCTDCHTGANHKKGAVFSKWMEKGKTLPIYKETVFMNVIRRRIFMRYPDAIISYGSDTTPRRLALGLSKTHFNDAIAISGVDLVEHNPDSIFSIVQFRKKKRSLHEATARKGRKEANRLQKRNSKNKKKQLGFFLNDKVCYKGQIAWISGFNGKTMAFLKGINDSYIIDPSKAYKQIKLSDCKRICHQNNWKYVSHISLINS